MTCKWKTLGKLKRLKVKKRSRTSVQCVSLVTAVMAASLSMGEEVDGKKEESNKLSVVFDCRDLVDVRYDDLAELVHGPRLGSAEARVGTS